jgi:hypothetical protein
MVALHAAWHNLVRIHKTSKVTRRWKSGVTDRLWSRQDVVGIVDEWEGNQKAL